jgi:hypothetical protein
MFIIQVFTVTVCIVTMGPREDMQMLRLTHLTSNCLFGSTVNTDTQNSFADIE